MYAVTDMSVIGHNAVTDMSVIDHNQYLIPVKEFILQLLYFQ